MQPSRRPSPGQPSRRRRGLAAALVAVLPLLSGCASGFDSPVLQDYNPAVGVNVRDDGVWGMNLLVVAPESGSRGTLVGVLLNKTRAVDRLVGVTVESEQGAPPLRSSMLRPSIVLLPGRLVQLSEPPTVAVEGEARQGFFVELTLQFQRSEPIQVKVPVVAPIGAYEDVPLP